METQKFTEKSLLALENAQKEALRRQNSELSTLHLLHALIFQENGFVPMIIEKMRIDFSRMKQLLDRALKSLPAYSTSSNGRLISSSNISLQ